MKIIDLLNKIANGEKVPYKIKYESEIYTFNKKHQQYENELTFPLGAKLILDQVLNDEVEIIEEPKKIEKIEPLGIDYMTLDDIKFTFSNSEMVIVNKINEIIDYINKED